MSGKISIRLFDFRIYNEDLSEESDDEGETKQYIEKKDKKETIIQMFGMNEEGETFAINVMNFKPFFYVKVPLYWDLSNMKDFERKVNKKIGNYYSESVNKFKLITKKKLYGFDNNKYYNFIKISFKNTTAFNKVKALWYTENEDFRKRKLIDNGYERTVLYEAKLPPLLRFFHINDISPSGWISFNENDIDDEIEFENQTCCDNEYWIDYKTIRAEKKKETAIPLKICSFDIEASSSHGDFPLAKKTYLKLCRQIVIYWTKNRQEIRIKSPEEKQTMLIELIYAAHGYSNMEGIDKIYLKKETTSKKKINNFINKIIFEKIKKYNEWPKRSSRDETDDIFNISKKKTIIFKNKEVEKRNIVNLLDSKEDIVFKSDILNRIFTGIYNYSKIKVNYLKDGIKINKPGQIINIDDLTLDLNEVEKKFVKGRIEEKPKYRKASSHYFDSLIIIPELCLPFVEGDTVTFIGSTFMRLGEKEQYLNNMIVLNSCSDCPDVPNCEIETYEKEKDVLLAWTRMIQREDPDIVIGYNIFGFDYKFMIERAEELGCKAKFLQLGRLLGEQSRVIDSSIKIASGTHDLKYIKMEGRIQIDLYNHFRREINLPSYKLDNVASHFIGDIIKDITNIDNKTVIKSKNMMGLKNGHYICFEILGHSTDKYKQGKKFIVEQMNSDSFVVNSRELAEDLKGKKCRWCLAKDDVTPQDIFRLTNEGPDERAIIAKYCFQDCNLVHNLMMKNDIFTGMSEIANICYVPVEFIVMRGQGIKLLSFIAKKCSEKNTLMPVLDVEKGDSSYEGAICLKPYCGLYIDNPVAVVDYASLYPSSMISENISHDSKVWTKEYDMKGNIVTDNMGNEGIHGIRDKEGNFKYDNLEGYEYVDITYDRYIWRNKGKGKAREKVKVGTKTCRFAQFPEGKKAIMPAVLHELLAGRKATRKFIKYKTVSLKNGEEYDGLYSVKNEKCKVVGEKETWEFDEADVSNVKDTYDDFMKNVFDKRQQGLKVTANSLYGQTGARTSSFYEMDIAASTTATGRKLLIYGKKIIEGIYGNKICDTTYGKIRCKSKVVYGDSVTGDEPLILQNEDNKVVIKTIESLSNDWIEYENFKPFDTVESNRREKQKAFVKYKVWANGKWNPIKKVIRHKTNKKIYRVNTHTGVVDVTGDHSLVNDKFEKIKPTDCIVGKTKLSHTFPEEFIENDCIVLEQGIKEELNETLYSCSTCKEKYKKEFYYMDKKRRGKQCKLCIKKRACKRLGEEFNGKLDKEIINIHTKSYEITEDEARVWGMFMGDGSCGKYKNGKKGRGNKFTWALNNATLERLHYYKEILERVEPIKFKVLDTLKSSGVYKLVPVGSIVYMVNKYRPLFYDENKEKLVPDCILNSKLSIRKAFFEGYYDADGAKTHNYGIDKRMSFLAKNKITAQCLYYLATSIGYKKLSVNYKSNNGNDYYTISSCKKWGKDPTMLKKMEITRNSGEEYVYDLETEDGIFACGVGKLQIFNTDSCFMTFNAEELDGTKITGKKALDITIQLAIECGEIASKFLKPPHDLEYEKTFDPFLLLSKKRYVGMLYEHDVNKCKRKSMGIVLKRRDNAPVVKDIYGGIIDIIMKSQDIEAAVLFTKSFLKDIIDEKIPLDKLIITKSLREFYKCPESIAHKVLADRMGKRDPGNKPSTGSRIPFIYIKTKKKVKLQGERIEHPDYIKEHGLKPDYKIYITNQIMKPVMQIYALVLEQLKIFKRRKKGFERKVRSLERKWKDDDKKCVEYIMKERNKHVKELLFNDILRVYDNKQTGQKTITSLFGF
tara:strand:+ start:1069 stop:6435 length:5367 start_codon:yes stop_codon:yes gene_type:complete